MHEHNEVKRSIEQKIENVKTEVRKNFKIKTSVNANLLIYKSYKFTYMTMNIYA